MCLRHLEHVRGVIFRLLHFPCLAPTHQYRDNQNLIESHLVCRLMLLKFQIFLSLVNVLLALLTHFVKSCMSPSSFETAAPRHATLMHLFNFFVVNLYCLIVSGIDSHGFHLCRADIEADPSAWPPHSFL